MKYVLNKSRDRQKMRADKRLPSIQRTYNDRQPYAPLQIKEFLITTVKKERCCLLRWVKELEMDMDAVTFAMTQLDSHGNEIVTRVLSLDQIPHCRQGSIFTPDHAFTVEANCTAVRVQILTMQAGKFIYHYDHPDTAEPVVDYRTDEAWVYDATAVYKANLNEELTQRVRSKRSGRVRFLWVFAILTVMVLVGMIFKPYIAYLFPQEEGKAFFEFFKSSLR